MLGTLVSPDGRTVAMVGREAGVFFVRQTARGPCGRSAARSKASPISGAPTARRSTLGTSDKEPLTFYRYDLATGRSQLWKQLAPPDMTGFLRYGSRLKGPGFAVTPDGRYYAYTYFTDQSRLVLADAGPNWWK